MVLETVAMEKKTEKFSIMDCEGKNVVAIFGNQQTGKSTTINALRLGPLTMVKQGKFLTDITFFPPHPTDESEVAPMGSGNTGCTPAPKPYSLKNVPYFRKEDFAPEEEYREWVLLDTRGFFDERYPNEMVASALLTENALNSKAKSVRLVFLLNARQFLTDVSSRQEFGKMFGRLVKNDNVPVLFLFNNPPEELKKKPASLVIEYIEEKWKIIEKELEKLISECRHRILERLMRTAITNDEKLKKLFEKHKDVHELMNLMNGSSKRSVPEEEKELFTHLYTVMTNDEEYRNNEASTTYLRVMKKAIGGKTSGILSGWMKGDEEDKDAAKSYIGFIDPEDESSIEEVRRQIRQDLKELNGPAHVYLDFSEYNHYVVKFHESFNRNVHIFLDLLKGQQLLLKYPTDVIAAFDSEVNKKIDECRYALADLERNGSKKEVLAMYQKQFHATEFSAVCRELENVVKGFQLKKNELLERQNALLRSPPEEVVVPFFKRGYHPIVTASFDECPYNRVKDLHLECGTQLLKNLSHGSYYKAQFENGSAWRNCFLWRWMCSEVVARGRVTLEVDACKRTHNKATLERMDAEKSELERSQKQAEKKLADFQENSKNNIAGCINSVLAEKRTQQPVIEDFKRFRMQMENILSTLAARCGMKDDGKPVSNIAEKMHPVIKLHLDAVDLMFDAKKRCFEFEEFQSVCGNVQCVISAIEKEKRKREEEMKEGHVECKKPEVRNQFSFGEFSTEFTKKLRNDIITEFPIGEFAEVHPDPPVESDIEEGSWIVMKQKGKWLLRNSKTYKTEELCDANKPLPPEWKKTKIDGDNNEYVVNKKTGVLALVRVFDDDRLPATTQTVVESKKVTTVMVPAAEPVEFSSWKQFFEACGVNDADGSFARLFEENDMELDQIPELTEEILKDIIVKRGPVMKIVKYLKTHYPSKE